MSAPNFEGVAKNNVGPLYNCAIGFDPGTGTVDMVGYVIEKGSDWEQTTRLQDEGQLTAVASPNQIDRSLTPWPRVTQGDWSKGEMQETFIDPAMYRSSDGRINVSKPGELSLFPGPRTTSFAVNGTYNHLPFATEGNRWFAGASTSLPSNFVLGNATGVNRYNIGDNTEILDMLYYPNGLIIATATHIYHVDASVGPPPSTTLIANDGVSPDATRALAYFNEKVYYIDPTRTMIKSLTDNVVLPITPVVEKTRGAGFWEGNFQLIASTADGLLVVTNTEQLQNQVLYLFDGVNLTRVADIWGTVVYAAEIYGITFILALQFQDSLNNHDFTLYQLQGSQLSVVLDMRWLPDEFRATPTNPDRDQRGHLHGDGRFLYIGWPGMYGIRLDLVATGVSRCGGGFTVNQNPVKAHKILWSEQLGVVDVGIFGTTTFESQEFFQNATAGTIVLSDIDFDTPTEAKAFKAVYVQTKGAPPAGSSISVQNEIDDSGTYASATLMPTSPPTNQVYLLPSGSIGGKVSTKVTLTPNGSGQAATIKSISTEGTLGRVWKATLQCHLVEQLLDGSTDAQGKSSQQLLGNLEAAYNSAARRVFLYVPSLEDPSQVEEVTAILSSYNYRGKRPEIEGVVDVVLTESF